MRSRAVVALPAVALRVVALLGVSVLAGCSAAPHPRAAVPVPGPGSPAASPSESGASAPPSRTPSTASPTAGRACAIFPADNVWHSDVSHLPVLAGSATYVASMGTGGAVHADFGSGTYEGEPIGIPVTTMPAGQPGVRVTFAYKSESDPGPYPVPRSAAIEGAPASTGDRHVIVYDPVHCRDYELFAAYLGSGGSWRASAGAVYDLRSNKLRPAGWTSADAAGLPILPGLVRWSEVAVGHIDHAIRVTADRTRAGYVWPARHRASSGTDASLPPMGLWLRLKASVNVSRLPAQARVVAQAMQRYGVIVADNGSSWYLSGTPDAHWDNDALHALGGLRGGDFEAVDTSSIEISPNSGATR